MERPAIPNKLDSNDEAAKPFLCRIEILIDGVKWDRCYAYDKIAGTADGWKTNENGRLEGIDGKTIHERRTGKIEVRWIEERSNATSAPTESSTIAPASAANRIR